MFFLPLLFANASTTAVLFVAFTISSIVKFSSIRSSLPKLTKPPSFESQSLPIIWTALFPLFRGALQQVSSEWRNLWQKVHSRLQHESLFNAEHTNSFLWQQVRSRRTFNRWFEADKQATVSPGSNLFFWWNRSSGRNNLLERPPYYRYSLRKSRQEPLVLLSEPRAAEMRLPKTRFDWIESLSKPLRCRHGFLGHKMNVTAVNLHEGKQHYKASQTWRC